MRILYLANNWVGWRLLQWLKNQGEEIIGVVVHSVERQRYGREIITTSGLSPEQIFYPTDLQQGERIEAIRSLRPDLGLSVFFGHILGKEVLSVFPGGCLNLHPAYLPYNRGAHPNIWSIVDGTPAGVTLHYIDQGMDTGDIIGRQEIVVEPVDTGETLYRKLESACLDLFVEIWPKMRKREVVRMPQDLRAGSFHRIRDLEKIDLIDLEREYKARDLINIIRARTFPPYRGVYFEHHGKRIYLRLQLTYGDEVSGENI